MKRILFCLTIIIAIVSCRTEKTPGPVATAVTPVTVTPPPVVNNAITVTSISPISGPTNTVITIRGAHFSPSLTGDTVKFNGAIAKVLSASDTTLTVLAPLAGTDGIITVNAAAGKASGPLFTYGPDIYVVGTVRKPHNYMVTYWRNGTAYYLTSPLGGAFGTGLALSDTDVYIAGYEDDTGAGPQGRYWKNFTEGVLSEGSIQHTTGTCAVSGTDLYVAGWQQPPQDTVLTNSAEFWKNGIETLLTAPNEYAQAYAVAVSGSDVYVTGTTVYTNYGYSGAVYWKNGVENQLPKRGTVATGIVVTSNNDVYICGYDEVGPIGYAVYWKNSGASVVLSNNATASCIAVSGSDVYVGGLVFNGIHYVATYWKNGVAISLTDSTTDAVVNGITVVGNDVYACGYQCNSPSHSQYPDDGNLPTYWKNGVPVVLVDQKTTAGYAASIIVRPHGAP